MNSNLVEGSQDGSPDDFDLVRLSQAKHTCGVCANTIRSYHLEGLPLYRAGKAVFFSKSELAKFIRQHKAEPTTN